MWSEAQSDVVVDVQRVDGASRIRHLLIGVKTGESDQLVKHMRGDPGSIEQGHRGKRVRHVADHSRPRGSSALNGLCRCLKNFRVVGRSLPPGREHWAHPIEEPRSRRNQAMQIRELEVRVRIHERRENRRTPERDIGSTLIRRNRNNPPVVDRDDSPVDRRIGNRQNPVGRKASQWR